MSISVPDESLNHQPETPAADHTSKVDTTRRSFLAKMVTGVAVAAGGALAGVVTVQSINEKQAEKKERILAANYDLLSAMNDWGNLQNDHLSPIDRKYAFVSLTRNLKSCQTNRAHADEVNHLPRDRKLPDWDGMTDEEMVAGTEISLTKYRQLRGEIYAGYTDPVGGSEPGAMAVKSLPEPAPTPETIAGN